MGKALTYVTNYENIKLVKAELSRVQKGKDERDKISVLNAEIKRISDIDKLSIEQGLNFDKQLLNN